MSTVSQLLRQKADETGAPLWVVEKDYALSYLLAAIANTPNLGNEIILKGGTALKKIYFPDHRFSEDLDFTRRPSLDIRQIDDEVSAAMRQAETMLQHKGPFYLQTEQLTLRDPHPGDQAAFTVRVQFPHQRRPMCRLKIEITVDEPILLLPETHPILHGFDEPFDATARIYPLVEIVAEKLRALLQSQARLSERGWGASRVCRDYYDLWHVLKFTDFTDADLESLTIQKCEARGITLHSPQEFFAPGLVQVAKKEWDRQLAAFVYHPQPSVDQVIEDVKAKVLQLWRI